MQDLRPAGRVAPTAAAADAGDDVPSPIDLCRHDDALAWAASALRQRPVRSEFFAHFADALAQAGHGQGRWLELGSGPGFLAAYLLQAFAPARYVLLDHSTAMHALAAQRLGPASTRVRFCEADLRDPAWPVGLGPVDAVLTLQAVHELRHKRHAPRLHTQVHSLLAGDGIYLVADHHAGDGGMMNEQLYMRVDEQVEALRQGGFSRIETLRVGGGLALHRARP